MSTAGNLKDLIVGFFREFHFDDFETVQCAETHTKRQATQHDCLPSLLGDGANALK